MGVEDELQAREDRLVGILNGIDTAVVGSGGRSATCPATYTWPDLGRQGAGRPRSSAGWPSWA